jgi:hypothetical protein
MVQHLLALERRRSLLIERAEVQRQAMAAAASGLERPLHWFDTGMSLAHTMRPAGGIPGISLLGTLLSMTSHFGRTSTWIARTMMLYQVFKLVRSRFGSHATVH